MTDNGRLIINARGETAQVSPARPRTKAHAVSLQLSLLADAVTTLPNGLTIVWLALATDEADALALKLADANGKIAELRLKDVARHG